MEIKFKKELHNTLILTIMILFIGCKPEEPTTPIDNIPEMPNVSSIGDSNKIEIVTWNIEHFPKADYTTEYVKAIIEGLDADIYMLQEIQSRDRLATMLSEMDDYNYYLQTNSIGLNLAVIYNNVYINIKSTIELFTEDDDGYFASRPPLLVNLEWQNNGIKKDLSVINVHYKCCGDNSISYVPDADGKWDDEYRRLKASELLEKYISDNLSDKNVIVAGDFNDAIDEVDSTNVFLPYIVKPTEYKFADMDIALGDAINWSWQGWSSSYPAIHFDHILINNNLFDELDNSGVVDVIKLEEYFENGITEYDENVSDHRPVYLVFSP
jgi:exonuclease III